MPIEGAKVKIHNDKREVVKEGRTDDYGRFQAKNLEAGVYTIEASKEKYTQRTRPKSDITNGDEPARSTALPPLWRSPIRKTCWSPCPT